MYYVSEEFCEANVSQREIVDAVADVFVAMADGTATNFPTVREALTYKDALFGFKSGIHLGRAILGVKAGGYWPHNGRQNRTNHQSTVILFDLDTGLPAALVRANYLTGLRTAAASAISIRHLARQDAAVLGILGAGAQSIHQIRAALQQREFRRLIITDIDMHRANSLAASLYGRDLQIDIFEARQMVMESDVIITVTPSFVPVIDAEWVRDGTHLACMGADTKGKQEVDEFLFSRAVLFCDDVDQAISIGESQHATRKGMIRRSELIPIGDVISGKRHGRRTDSDITIFDGTGVGLQDLVAAQVALDQAIASQAVIELL